jgi:hypothetical protein
MTTLHTPTYNNPKRANEDPDRAASLLQLLAAFGLALLLLQCCCKERVEQTHKGVAK